MSCCQWPRENKHTPRQCPQKTLRTNSSLFQATSRLRLRDKLPPPASPAAEGNLTIPPPCPNRRCECQQTRNFPTGARGSRRTCPVLACSRHGDLMSRSDLGKHLRTEHVLGRDYEASWLAVLGLVLYQSCLQPYAGLQGHRRCGQAQSQPSRTATACVSQDFPWADVDRYDLADILR